MDSVRILDVITRVHNRFGLSGQAGEFVTLIGKLINTPGVTFFYLDESGKELQVLACKPAREKKRLSNVVFEIDNQAITRLQKTGTTLVWKDILAGRIISDIALADGDDSRLRNTGLIVPVISREKLTGIIFIDRPNTGNFTQDEIILINDITSRLAPGFEKEYLREQISVKEQELTVLYNCTNIIASSFNIPEVYPDFAAELKKILDIDWLSVTIKDKDGLTLLARYPDTGDEGDFEKTILSNGSATGEIPGSNIPLMQFRSNKNTRLLTGYRGIRSFVCIPLLTDKNELTGSLTVGSKKTGAYNSKQVEFLSLLGKRIAMPLKNARLYADVLDKSLHDELTGLLNRRSMDEQIVSEINRHERYGGVFSLIIMDLDSMKVINDKSGHPAGDGLLARVGRAIEESIRRVDKPFRYGGDEFAILLPDTPVEAAMIVSERVRKNLEQKLYIDDKQVTASFGLASWPKNGPGLNHLIRAADAALYKAKHEGGNRSCIYNGRV